MHVLLRWDLGGGYNLKFKNINAFMKEAIKDEINIHKPFLRSRKYWIKVKIENPGKNRVRDKKGLEAAQVVDAIEERGREWANDWDFVEKDTFLEENAGDPEKIKNTKFVKARW
eukprot:1320432-Pyramimonas_sp.AAC.1